MDKLKDWFFEDGEDYDGEEEVVGGEEVVDTEPKTSLFEKAKSMKTSKAIDGIDKSGDGQLILFEPRSFDESKDIALYLRQKKAAVVNLHRLQKDTSKRVIDFLCGVLFAIDGDIQKIGPKIFLCTPKNIGVTGTISMDEEIEEE